LDFTEDIIKEVSGAIMNRRIIRIVDGKVVPTTAVILSYEGDFPKEVFINFRRFTVTLLSYSDSVWKMPVLWT